MVYLNGMHDCKGCEMLRAELATVKREKMKQEQDFENKLQLEWKKGYHIGAHEALSTLPVPVQANSPINLDTPSPPPPPSKIARQKRNNFTTTPTTSTPPPPMKTNQRATQIRQEPARGEETARMPVEKSNEDSGEDDEDEPPSAIFQKDLLTRSPISTTRRQAPPQEEESRKRQKTTHTSEAEAEAQSSNQIDRLSQSAYGDSRRTMYIPGTRSGTSDGDTGTGSREKVSRASQKEKESAKPPKGVHMSHVQLKPLPSAPPKIATVPRETTRRHSMDSIITDPIILKARMVNSPRKYSWEMIIYQAHHRDRTTITMKPDFSYNSSEKCYICVGMFQRPLHISLGDFLHKRYAKQTTQKGQIIPVQSQFSLTPADGPLGFQLTAEDTTQSNPLVLHSKESIKFTNITSSTYTIDSHALYNFQKYTTNRKYGPEKGSDKALRSEISFIFRHNTRGKLTSSSTADQLLSLVACEIRLYPKNHPKAPTTASGSSTSRRNR